MKNSKGRIVLFPRPVYANRSNFHTWHATDPFEIFHEGWIAVNACDVRGEGDVLFVNFLFAGMSLGNLSGDDEITPSQLELFNVTNI